MMTEAPPLYVPCPRCKGDQLISVCTDPGNDWRPSRWEYVTCPLCHGTKEADRELAEEWLADQPEGTRDDD